MPILELMKKQQFKYIFFGDVHCLKRARKEQSTYVYIYILLHSGWENNNYNEEEKNEEKTIAFSRSKVFL